jgi:hypothetical protein
LILRRCPVVATHSPPETIDEIERDYRSGLSGVDKNEALRRCRLIAGNKAARARSDPAFEFLMRIRPKDDEVRESLRWLDYTYRLIGIIQSSPDPASRRLRGLRQEQRRARECSTVQERMRQHQDRRDQPPDAHGV